MVADSKRDTDASAPSGMTLVRGDCLEWMQRQPDNSVDFVFGSPPYAENGLRYAGNRRNLKTAEWIDWMLRVTTEAVRISRGMVIWVVNGPVRKGRYLPACEGLIWKWHQAGGWCERPCIWHKNSLPNRREWFINTWEYVLAFKQPGSQSTFHWQSVAQPPSHSGPQSFEARDGHGRQFPVRKKTVDPAKLARPRDILSIPVGGGLLGHPLAHQNEAPFPLKLALHFVKVCSKPNDVVLDPFVGSGTTLQACQETGRRGIGIDVRRSQVRLANRRLQSLSNGRGDTDRLAQARHRNGCK